LVHAQAHAIAIHHNDRGPVDFILRDDRFADIWKLDLHPD